MSTPTLNPTPLAPAASTNGEAHPPLATSNGSAPASSRLPKAGPSSFLRKRLPLIALAALLLAGAAFAVFFRFGKVQTYDGPTAEAKMKRLQVTVVERGTLESAENSDIICRVKASTKGSSVSTHIKWVIPDGTPVEAGQLLMELDDSALQDSLRDQRNKVTEAEAAWIEKKENLKIVRSQNFSDIEKAKTDKVIAEIDLRKYVGERASQRLLKIDQRTVLNEYLAAGLQKDLAAEEIAPELRVVSEYVQALNDIEGKIEIARSDREMWLDRSAWSVRMVKKGLLMRSQADSDKFRLESADIALRKVQTELAILQKFSLERGVTDLWSKVKEADRALDRVQTQALAKETLAKADMDSKESIFDQEKQKQKEIEDEIRKCTIYSPQSGMVVYYLPESSRFGGSSSSSQSLIQEGEPVRDGQKLMRIPNLSHMMVSTRVHEAMVSKVKGELYADTGFTDAVRAGLIAGTPDVGGVGSLFAYNLRARDEFRELEKDKIFDGHRAVITVDASAGFQRKGHVKSVATVASQADWSSSDVKVYQTMVEIEGTVSDLKPGMSAEVTIFTDESSADVLTIPIQAIVGSINMGAKRKCFVIHEGGRPEERDIEVGMSNDKEAEIKSGLKPGEKVALNPRVLLGEKSDMKPASAKQRGASEGGGKKGKKGAAEGGAAGSTPGADPKARSADPGSLTPLPAKKK